MDEQNSSDEKALEKTEKAAKIVGQASNAAGTATQAAGKTVRVAGAAGKGSGKAVNYAGKGVSYAGKGMSAAGKGITNAGKALNSTKYGAILGVPLAAAGTAINAAGKATETAGKGVSKAGEGVEKAGYAVNKAGKKVDNTGKRMRDFGKKAEDKSKNVHNLKSYLEKSDKGMMSMYRKMSPKQKLIVFAIGTVIALFPVIFICVLTSPLWIDSVDFGIGGTTGGSYAYGNYTSVQGNSTYWWPIGSDNTVTKNGIIYATGEPASSVITSPFSYRSDPYTGNTSMHTGLDIGPLNRGYGEVNVIAAKSGTVTVAKNDPNCESNGNDESCNGSGYGNYIMITHDDGNTTVYGHLHKNTIAVSEGQKVSQGQVIAKVGSSGRSTGLHLHFEIRENGSVVDPENYVSMDNPRPKDSSSNYISGSNNKQSICLTLKNKGFSNNAVAALLTNINAESSFDPETIGDHGTSYGLCQWHNERWNNLKTMFPDSYSEVGSQLEFLTNELQTSYTSVYNYLNESNTADAMTYYFCYNFEKPYEAESTCTNRKRNANVYATYVNNGCQ